MVMLSAIIVIYYYYYCKANHIRAFTVQNGLGPLEEERLIHGGKRVEDLEDFLEEVPMKDKPSGGLALPANGARRSQDKEPAWYFRDPLGHQTQAPAGQGGYEVEGGWAPTGAELGGTML